MYAVTQTVVKQRIFRGNLNFACLPPERTSPWYGPVDTAIPFHLSSRWGEMHVSSPWAKSQEARAPPC